MAGAFGQESPVHWSAAAPKGPVQAGARFEVKLDARIDGIWHMYSATQPPGGPIATRFKVLGTVPFELDGKIRQSEPERAFDANFGIDTEFFTGSAEFWIPLKASAAAKPGEYEMQIQAYYQVCDNRQCLPPHGEPVQFKVKVTAKTGAAEAATAIPAGSVPGSR
jgi:hypothetical protein